MENNLNLLHEDEQVFGGFFNEWRIKRTKKLENIFGKEWFKGKKILELGCAHGNIGFYFQSLGSDVTFSDARQELLDVVKKKDINAKTILLNQESDWSLPTNYDLIIHFGVLYNLDKWETDLNNTIKHANYVALDTAVNIFVNEIEFKIKNMQYGFEQHGPFEKIGSLPSTSLIEKHFKALNVDFKRYDDSDLNVITLETAILYDINPTVTFNAAPNTKYHVHNWGDSVVGGGRKFWIIKNEK